MARRSSFDDPLEIPEGADLDRLVEASPALVEVMLQTVLLDVTITSTERLRYGRTLLELAPKIQEAKRRQAETAMRMRRLEPDDAPVADGVPTTPEEEEAMRAELERLTALHTADPQQRIAESERLREEARQYALQQTQKNAEGGDSE